MPKRTWDWHDDIELWTPASSRIGLGNAALAGLDPWEPPPLQPIYLPIPVRTIEEEKRPYSNAQFGVSHPHDELAIIVSSHTEIKADGDSFVGTLSDIGAQLLLVREGQNQIQPLAGAGSFRLRIKDGLVVKYQVQLEGIFLVEKKRVHVHQSASTSISNIGATSVELVPELQRKLAQ